MDAEAPTGTGARDGACQLCHHKVWETTPKGPPPYGRQPAPPATAKTSRSDPPVNMNVRRLPVLTTPEEEAIPGKREARSALAKVAPDRALRCPSGASCLAVDPVHGFPV